MISWYRLWNVPNRELVIRQAIVRIHTGNEQFSIDVIQPPGSVMAERVQACLNACYGIPTEKLTTAILATYMHPTVECSECDGTGNGDTSGDPQNGFDCPNCDGDGSIPVESKP